MNDILFSGQLLFAALVTGSLYAITALGLNLVYGTMRMLNVAHGDLVMLGAYGAFWGFTLFGISPLLAAWLLAGIGAVAGALLYVLVIRRLLKSGSYARSHRLEGNSLLLFFGLSIVVQNVVALLFTPNNRGLTYLNDVVRIGDVAMTGNRLASLIIAVSVCAVIAAYLKYSVVGMGIRALIDRREAAEVVGVNVERVQIWSFAVGFGTATLAGALVSMLEPFSPFSGFPFTVAAFIVIILGGMGNLLAGLGAAFFLGFLETYGVALTSANLRSVLLYGAFVMALLLFPQGLFNLRSSQRM